MRVCFIQSLGIRDDPAAQESLGLRRGDAPNHSRHRSIGFSIMNPNG